MSKIAVFGSAFNPPTLGHKSVVDSLSHFDLVLLVPSISHAWGKKMIDYELRCNMVELFIEDIGPRNFSLSRIEKEIQIGAERVTTFDVLSAIQDLNKNADITFVVGPDNILHFDSFHKADTILRSWSVLSCPEKVDIRSSYIRRNLAANRSIDSLTTPSVSRYIMQHNCF
ncbi:MAG: nicotinate-nicotinamide nucleotide adenylyltransferase [Aliivibrio sp.]|uniref:nicotinate-nicotinamide nucleotide adenylyltransferase n=1 Tax=Aliivibrio sp. TaxID=1872443 RepID=UPI001A3FCAC0|nr:nicotinate-nicotinamide nucleotide adenylyltransferase [Aliivibrio sp.]